MRIERVDIVGGGPVGLLAALLAVHAGFQPVVYERRMSPRPGSRSIGVHPPSLELLERLGLARRFLDRGVRVERGVAVGAGGPIGAVDFASCIGRHRYVLSVPQADTESILREALEERAPGSLLTGHDFVSAQGSDSDAIALIACDGKYSSIREAAGINFDGGVYDGRYAMADFPDNTQFGSTAMVFFGCGGLVESFPLPVRRRRWVIRRDEIACGAPTAEELVDTVRERTKHQLVHAEAVDLTGFRAERFMASTLAQGRTSLAGDAGHIVSPIGGQGMNLGWLGVADLMGELESAARTGGSLERAVARSARRRSRMARAAARRAEVNMWLGRPRVEADSRERIISALLREPIAALLANVFTMRGLAAGV